MWSSNFVIHSAFKLVCLAIKLHFLFSAAAFLLVSLVPNTHFRQGYRTTRNLGSPHKELLMSSEAQLILQQVYSVLLRLLKPAKHYTDIQAHGAMKLTAYFVLLTYCCISRAEKLMVSVRVVLIILLLTTQT